MQHKHDIYCLLLFITSYIVKMIWSLCLEIFGVAVTTRVHRVCSDLVPYFYSATLTVKTSSGSLSVLCLFSRKFSISNKIPDTKGCLKSCVGESSSLVSHQTPWTLRMLCHCLLWTLRTDTLTQPDPDPLTLWHPDPDAQPWPPNPLTPWPWPHNLYPLILWHPDSTP